MSQSRFQPRRATRRIRQLGISLLELIAALAIIAIIIIGALSLVSQADTSAKSSELLRGLAALRAGTIAATTSEVGFGRAGSNLNTALIRSRRVPDNWTQANDFEHITHGYGGAVNVTSNGATFSISLVDVPVEACIQLISQQAGTSWRSVTIGGGALVLFPTTLLDATTACTATVGGEIVFTSAS